MRELSISSKTFRIAGIVFCLAILTGELSYLSTALIHVSDTLLLILITLLLFGTVCTIAEPARANCLAYTMVFGSVTLFWLLEFAKKRIEITGVHEACAKYGLIALAAMTMLWFVNCGRQYERDGIALTSQIKDGWKNYLPVIVICAIYILLYIPNFNVWFKIDSYTYYSSVADNAGKWSFTFSDMAALRMGGHNTYAYSILMTIGQLLVSRNGIGQRLVNLGLSIITIVTFYGITLKIWDDNIRRSTLLTGVFSVSPLMLGISYLVSTDFPLLCFFTILIYASIRGDKFFEYMMVYAVCFTKETGLIFVTAFYLTRYLIVNKGNLLAALKRVPIQRVMFAALPILLYAAILLLGSGGWSKNFREAFHNAAEVNYDVPADAYVWWHYPIYKCFEYFVMNFYWLSLVLIVVDAIAIKMSCAKNGIRIREYLAARCESKMFSNSLDNEGRSRPS